MRPLSIEVFVHEAPLTQIPFAQIYSAMRWKGQSQAS